MKHKGTTNYLRSRTRKARGLTADEIQIVDDFIREGRLSDEEIRDAIMKARGDRLHRAIDEEVLS